MSGSPYFAFDVTLEAYRQAWEEVYVTGHLRALDASALKRGGNWHPDRKPRLEDFVADFQLAGERALNREGLHSRVVLFNIHFAGRCPYERAKEWFGLSDQGWERWTNDIRRIVGKELIERGIYPPRKYFGEMGTREKRGA
jgi:hypothetical protein